VLHDCLIIPLDHTPSCLWRCCQSLQCLHRSSIWKIKYKSHNQACKVHICQSVEELSLMSSKRIATHCQSHPIDYVVVPLNRLGADEFIAAENSLIGAPTGLHTRLLGSAAQATRHHTQPIISVAMPIDKSDTNESKSVEIIVVQASTSLHAHHMSPLYCTCPHAPI
jgi:hypothetical protein